MVASDDVLAAHKPGPNVLVHRPRQLGELQPACAAVNNDGPWLRFGAYVARTENACLCHDQLCFPKGWASE